MKELKRLAQQASIAVVAAIVAVVGIAPSLFGSVASADGQVLSRSITMSSSAPGASGVSYAVTFTPATTITNPDYLVDFCSNDPLVGDSCTATAGTDVPNFGSATAKIGATTMTVATIGSGRGLKITGTSTYTSGTPTTITISNVTNPTAVASFYARIIVYANGAAGTNTSDSPGTYKDYGGVALSTASNISITAKVFETLTFCVYQTSCGTAPSLALGDTTTGALSSTNAYVNSNAKYDLATNAAGGVTVAMRGTTLCRSNTLSDCNTGSPSVFTISSMGATAVVKSIGSEQFGMCADVTGSAVLTVATPYHDTVGNCNGITTGTYAGGDKFGFDDNTLTGTNSASGSTVMSSTAAVPSVTGDEFAFLGDVAPTTEAGIYTTSLNMVATSTF